MIATKQLQRFQEVQSNCDHKKHTEKHGDLKMCFCTKLMYVTSENNNITNQEFCEQLIEYSLSQIDWDDLNRQVVEAIAKTRKKYGFKEN